MEMKFDFEALPILTKKEKKPDIFLWIFVGSYFLLMFIWDFFIGELPVLVGVIFFATAVFILPPLYIISKRKLKPKLSDFSININNGGIEVIDNDNTVFINKSEIYNIILHFHNIKGEWIGGIGRSFGYPSDGKENTIKIISANTTIEKKIFIPEDMFYHRFNLLGIRLKEMGFPVKMKGFYNY